MIAREKDILSSAILRIGAMLLAVSMPALALSWGLFQSHAASQFTNSLLPGPQGGEAADAAAKALRAGRDLIEEGRWQEAVSSFKGFVATYPRSKSVDAALYWLAFALKKQAKLVEADQTLVRLVREHPKSSWRDDAEAMRVEMAPQLGNQAAINEALDGSKGQADDEMKSLALQALVFSNPARALPLLQEILKPESEASRNSKQTAVAFLAQMRGQGFDTLLDVARNHKDTELRRTAIFWIGQSTDERAFEFLREVVMGASEKKELLDAALFAISQSRNPRARAYIFEVARSAPSAELRRSAVVNIGMRGGDSAVEELLAIYESEPDVEVKKQVLFAFSMSGAQARAKLIEVARGETNLELRKTAFFWLGQRGDEETLAQLIQMFDAEPNDEVKEHLLMVLAQSRSKTALLKLMEIAKTSTSLELRKRAIFWLGQSKDPEAKKFIEGLLK
jgi:HEAT repeat protein